MNNHGTVEIPINCFVFCNACGSPLKVNQSKSDHMGPHSIQMHVDVCQYCLKLKEMETLQK